MAEYLQIWLINIIKTALAAVRLALFNLDRKNNNRYPKLKEPFLDGKNGMVVKQLGHEKSF